MKIYFDQIRDILEKQGKTRQANKLLLAELASQQDTYTADYLENKQETIRLSQRNSNQVDFEKVSELLLKLKEAAAENQSKLDLSNPALTNALKLIELGSSRLDADTIRKINVSFTGDQSALRALKAVYQMQGVVDDGGLENQLYEPESTFASLQEYAYFSFMQNGSLNTFWTQVNKIANLEGIQYPELVDEAGAVDSMRRAAGLAV